jgi:hypothetical protein
MLLRSRSSISAGAVALFVAAFLSLVPVSARAAEPGEELTISMLTFGPGDHPFFKFGHIAILVHDDTPRTPRADLVYNFGTFTFDSPWLLIDFFQGRLKYWLSIQSLRGTLNAYKNENRTIDAQELNLTPAQRKQLADALWENARPENKHYKYDYYRDNCSTRVRDAIDKAVGGRIAAVSQAPALMSWRDHTLRLTVDDIPVFLGLHAAMGDLIDSKIKVWDEMFLPSRVAETIRLATVPGPNGDEPLVKSEKRLLDANRPPMRTTPPSFTLPMAAVGMALGALFALLGKTGTERKAARIAFGSLLAPMGFFIGFLGWLFLFFWTTDHEVAYRNENILQLSPAVFALTVVAVGAARGKARWTDLTFKVLAFAAASSLFGLVAKVLPMFDQHNREVIALFLPLWTGAAIGAAYLTGRLPRKTPST